MKKRKALKRTATIMFKKQHITDELLRKYKFPVTIPAGWSYRYDVAKFAISEDLFDAMTLGVCEVLVGAYHGQAGSVAMLNGTDYSEIPETEKIREGLMFSTINVKHKTVTLDGYICTGTFDKNFDKSTR